MLAASRLSRRCAFVPRIRLKMDQPPTEKMATFSEDKNGWTVVKEGKAEVLFPSLNDVFYNPVQEFNRDLSIAAIQLHANDQVKDVELGKKHSEGLRILEGLSASGLRSIRYAREIAGLSEIVANDLSKQAVESIKRNVEHNEVQDLVTPSHDDVSMVMYRNRKTRFDVIDLDPYGSPTLFLDAAVQAVTDGGLLLVTCTDMAVLCGNAMETCYTKYGAVPVRTKACHEQALRVVLQCIEAHANRYSRYIVPVVSLSIDFYVRVFVRVYTGQAECKKTFSKMGHVYQCTGCESMTVQPLGEVIPVKEKNFKYKLPVGPPVDRKCSFCSHGHHIGGPMWIGPLHDPEFVDRLIDSIDESKFGTHARMKGMLTVAREELADVPLYYAQDRLCSLVRTTTGKLTEFRSALLNAGYRVSGSHCNKTALKTDAPNEFIWDMMREWEKRHPANKKRLDDAATRILEGETKSKVSFEMHPEANPESRHQKLKRFQVNPERNWGPKARAKTSLFKDKEDEKRIRNQGKKRKKASVEERENKKLNDASE